MERYVIRKARLEDRTGLRSLVQSHQQDLEKIPLAKHVKAFVGGNEGYRVSVAETNGKIVGAYFTSVDPATREGNGKALFVEPAHRGREISEALVLHALKILASDGITKFNEVGRTQAGVNFLNRRAKVQGKRAEQTISIEDIAKRHAQFTSRKPNISFTY